MKINGLKLEQNKGCEDCFKNCKYRGLTTTKETNANSKAKFNCNTSKF